MQDNVAKRPCRGASEQEDKGDRAENSEIDGLSFAVDYGGCSETADDWTIGWATGIDKDDDDLDEREEFLRTKSMCGLGATTASRSVARLCRQCT